MSHYRSFIAVNRSSLPKTLQEQKNYAFSLFLTYDINSIHDSCEVVPIIPSTWLARRYPRQEFLDHQLQNDAAMPKDLQVDKFWGFMGRKKIAGERIFNNLAALTSLKRISRKNLFHGAEDCNRKQNQFAQ